MKPATRYVHKPVSDDPRDTEAWALTEAARRLIDAAREPGNAVALQTALQLNQRLWTIFQASITEADCQLPQALRENIAALSLLVDRQTVARLVDLDVSKFDLLIQINRSVAAGLSQRAEAAAAAAAAASAPGVVRPRVPAPAMPEPGRSGEPVRISV